MQLVYKPPARRRPDGQLSCSRIRMDERGDMSVNIDHRRRLQNLADVAGMNPDYLRSHRIGPYLAGQVTYNLGEYPARFSLAPTQYDIDLLARFRDEGGRFVQIHEEWSDSLRLLGADKLTSHDPEGLRAFIDLVHSMGIKIILYTSSGYFPATDPDFSPEWCHPDDHLVEVYFDYARCSPASPSWRAYLLPRLERVMDEYEIDGLYDDLGYRREDAERHPHHSYIHPSPEPDSAIDDLLGFIADLVHERGGVLKVHGKTYRGPHYDYFWVGESVSDLDRLRSESKDLRPYVVPCPDMSRAVIESEDDLYLHSVPYMQFPLRIDGRPVTGERAVVHGVRYRPLEKCFWTRHMRAVWQDTRRNPDTPPMYGWWDSHPGRPEARERWFHHYRLYRPMATHGTRAYLEIREGALFPSGLSDRVTASLFVNEQVYLVVANYGRQPARVHSAWQWRDRETNRAGTDLTIAPRSLRYFEREIQDETPVQRA